MPLRIVVLALALIAGRIADKSEYGGPQCLGPFCLDRIVSIRALFKRLGPPLRGA
jgi:hypothetical protein